MAQRQNITSVSLPLYCRYGGGNSMVRLVVHVAVAALSLVILLCLCGQALAASGAPAPPAVWLYYRFDEATGTVAVDSSGQGHNGTLTNGPTHSFGPAGMCRALSFNGVDQYVDTGTTLPYLQVPFSITLWIKPAATQVLWACVLGNHYTNHGFVIQMSAVANSLAFHFHLGISTAWANSPAFALTANIWQHVAIVVESTAQDNNGISTAGQIKVYHNGGLLHTTPYTGVYSFLETSNVLVGHGVDPARDSRYLNGLLDEVKIQSGALTADEVKSMAQMGDMWVHYEFNETSGTTTEDLSGSCHTGEFINGAGRIAGPLSGSGIAVSVDAASTQYVNTGTALPDLKEPFSAAMWVKPSATNGNVADIAGGVDITGAPKGWVLQMDSMANSNRYTLALGNGIGWLPSGDPWVDMPSTSWHHVAVTYNSGHKIVYLNGSFLGRITYTGSYVPPTTTNMLIGNGVGDLSRPWSGDVDSFRIYSHALSIVGNFPIYTKSPEPNPVFLCKI